MLSCSYENTATVTIDTGIRKQAQLSLIDKVIAWFSLSKAVQADPVPGQLQQQINQITLTVYASDMQAITQTIPLETGKITLEVPAGSQRTFEVVGYNSDNMREYGGIATVDLSPGQNVDLDIAMGELTFVNTIWDSDYQRVNIVYYKTYPQPIFFKVYENIGASAPIYKLIDTVAANTLQLIEVQQSILYYYTNPAINSDNFANFYISAVNQYGEGEKFKIN